MSYSDNLEDYFSDYLDGTLSPQQRQVFENRLKENPDALEKFERMRFVCEELRHLPAITTSADFVDRLHQRISEENRRPFYMLPVDSMFTMRNAAVAVAVVTVVSVSSMFFWSGNETISETPSSPQQTNSATINSFQQSFNPSTALKQSANKQANELAKAKQDSIDAKRRSELQNNIQTVNGLNNNK
jgi:anti-sigma factor RsiW